MNDYVKKPGASSTYTAEELYDIDQCQDDPFYFIQKFMKVQHPTKGSLPLKLFPFQERLVGAFHQYDKVVALTARQMGKQLDLRTPILTPQGFVTVGDLIVGSVIYGQNGKTTTVKALTPITIDAETYEIKFAHGESLIADANHLWTINIPGFKVQKTATVTTREMLTMVDSYRAKTGGQSLSITHCESIEFADTEVPIDPYFFGAWIGDGTLRSQTMTCAAADYDHYAEQAKQRGIEISEFRPRSGQETSGTFSLGREFGATLRALELTKTRTRNVTKSIPDYMIYTSMANRLELLRGLMDTDGTVEKNGVCRFYQSNEQLVDQVRFLLSSLGIKATKRVKKTIRKDCYILTFATDQNVCLLRRKAERLANLIGHPKNKRIYIESYSQVTSVPMRCIEVDAPDHLFLAGKTLVPTHNCVAADTIINVDGEPTEISTLISLSPRERLVTWLEGKLIRLASSR